MKWPDCRACSRERGEADLAAAVDAQDLDRDQVAFLDDVAHLIMQGALDENVLRAMQEKFAESNRAAGGTCDYRLFADSPHEWVAVPGPQTDKARQTVKEFIAKQTKTAALGPPFPLSIDAGVTRRRREPLRPACSRCPRR